ncbi:hypothetical protein A9G34_01110 [Gilliamella sp. Choc4-2]|uniref:hypothetical protein n=1 Tax=Gilliamella sp. Choc4-2 TaxID=3120237 RepID=UPI00080E1100|nr:hypothetical protein [Gilliamella apicola]OCG45730.1 hypothetical protein A9G34_01110 [Gilliamella apicola]
MFVSIKTIKNTIHVKTQYNPEFTEAAKQIGGVFDFDEKSWIFDSKITDIVTTELLRIFGTDGYNQSCVDVEVTVKKTMKSELGPIYLAGRIIAQAKARDGGARNGEKITFTKKSANSGGSTKYWTTEIEEGAVFRILDLYNGAVKFLDECDAIEYKIIRNVTDDKSIELAKLKAELQRITARIAELES